MSPLSVPKVFMAGSVAGFGYYLYMRQYWFPDPYKTRGVQNIEDRFSAGGGHPNHAPAQASERGSSEFGNPSAAISDKRTQEVQRTMKAGRKAAIRVQIQRSSKTTFQSNKVM